MVEGRALARGGSARHPPGAAPLRPPSVRCRGRGKAGHPPQNLGPLGEARIERPNLGSCMSTESTTPPMSLKRTRAASPKESAVRRTRGSGLPASRLTAPAIPHSAIRIREVPSPPLPCAAAFCPPPTALFPTAPMLRFSVSPFLRCTPAPSRFALTPAVVVMPSGHLDGFVWTVGDGTAETSENAG